MSRRKKIISKELDDQLRSVTFNTNTPAVGVPVVEPVVEKTEPAVVAAKEKIKPNLPPSLTKRVVTVEYLDKLERATIAQARYESVKEFSHLLSNLSIVLLSISIITYLIFYFISPQSPSLISLLILAFEAFALLGMTLFTISRTANLKQLAEITASDLSTASHIIGNPRGDIYQAPEEPTEAEVSNQ